MKHKKQLAMIYQNQSPNQISRYQSVDRNSSVNVSLSNVKLPKVHNKSIASASLDPIEYLPYDEKNYIHGNQLLSNKIKAKNNDYMGGIGLRE